MLCDVIERVYGVRHFYVLCELLNLSLGFRFLVCSVSGFLYVYNIYFSEKVRSTKIISPYQAISQWQLNLRLESVPDGLFVPLCLFCFL